MPYPAAAIIVVFAALMVLVGGPLIRKKWYRDFAVFFFLLAWSSFMAIGIAMNGSFAESLTTVYWVGVVLKPISAMLGLTVGEGVD
ncbi:conserved hypothetical protein [Paenibacillus curdlanolyticus YK9]|uniref:Uncharacterized protein n=1 Tax=Paenibacillus curdlanolyticus YK9 TaxID=717606 RepID=E0I7K2_9BACL|nr:hypothetical protein [Paenibacillus curdlanolyticus]EFM11555.1 conserved hypothetical protein [Paenibacillus curdlanolyticus YK9]